MTTESKSAHSVPLSGGSKQFFGSRFEARKFRRSIDSTLIYADRVVVDFKGANVTTSFVDELLGALVLKYGERFPDRVGFRNCSAEARAMIEYVFAARLHDHNGPGSL